MKFFYYFLGYYLFYSMMTHPITAEEVTFKKTFSDRQNLVVVKTELPIVPPTKEEIEEAKKELGPEAQVVSPEHIYLYSLRIESKDGAVQSVDWSRKVSRSKFEPLLLHWPFAILDAYLESETVVLVYKEYGWLKVDILRSSSSTKAMPVERKDLGRDGPFAKTIVKSVKIEGPFKDDLLVLQLEYLDGHSAKWVYRKNEWMEIKLPEDIHAKDNYGRTPLFMAVFESSVQRIEELLKKGAKVDAKDNHGETPLMNAAEHGNTEVIRILIEAGANVNARNNSGWTPLMYAAQRGQVEVVKLLIEKGADVNARDNYTVPVMGRAIKGKHQDVIEILKKAGAQDYKPAESKK